MAHLHTQIEDNLKIDLDIISAKRQEDLKVIINRLIRKFVQQEKKKEARHESKEFTHKPSVN